MHSRLTLVMRDTAGPVSCKITSSTIKIPDTQKSELPLIHYNYETILRLLNKRCLYAGKGLGLESEIFVIDDGYIIKK